MKKFEIGNIVLLKFPYTDKIDYKRRPALVIKDFEDEDTLVCRITSKIYHSKYDIYLNDWAAFGLKLPSVVRVHKLATLETDIIETLMGQIDNETLSIVKEIYQSIIEI
jgi:mRNA interferase MazF